MWEPSSALLEIGARFIGAAIEVHRHLGPGFTEGVYQRALSSELRIRGIPFVQEVPVDIVYKGDPVGAYRVDLIVHDRLLVELKAVEQIASVHVAQMISYLRATRISYGLILNFNVPRLQQGIRRVLFSPETISSP